MARLGLLLLLVCAAAHGQRNELWANPGLAERGLQLGEQQIILRQDLTACHGSAFESTRGVADEEKRKALGVALFRSCMAEKGWQARPPAPRRPPPKRDTTT